jgi:hypothetical protein
LTDERHLPNAVLPAREEITTGSLPVPESANTTIQDGSEF